MASCIKIHLNVISYLRPSLPGGSFLHAFPRKPCIFLPPIRATHPIPYIFLFLMTRIISDEYKSWSCSLCDFIHPPITSSVIGPSIFLSTLFPNTLPFFFLWWKAPQQMLRTHRSLEAYCATLWWRWLINFFFLVMDHPWNEIERGKPKYSGKNLSQCHFVHHKSHMDWPPEPWLGQHLALTWETKFWHLTYNRQVTVLCP
jgi:hypothetical protein